MNEGRESSSSSLPLALGAVLLLAAFIRFLAISVPRLNSDEGWEYYMAIAPWVDLCNEMMRDRMPFLFVWLYRLWLFCIEPSSPQAAHSEFLMRLPFLLTSTSTVLFTYLIAREWVESKVAIAASLFVAVVFPVWEYDTWARNQAMLGPLSVLCSWRFLRLLRLPNLANTLIYGVSCALIMNFHYWGCLVILGHVAVVAWERHQRLLAHFTAAGIVAVVLCLPMVSLLKIQIEVHAPANLAEVGSYSAAGHQLLRIFAMDTGLENLLGLFPLQSLELPWFAAVAVWGAACCALGALTFAKRADRVHCVILGAVPSVVLLILVAVKLNELTRGRYYVMTIPYVGILLAASCFAPGPRAWAGRVLAAVILAVNVGVIASYQMNPYFRSADFLTPARWIAHRAGEVQLVATINSAASTPLGYYLMGRNMCYDLSDIAHPRVYSKRGVAYDRFDTLEQLENGLKSVDRVAITFWLPPPTLQNWLSQRFGIVEELHTDSFDPDDQSVTYLLQRYPPPKREP